MYQAYKRMYEAIRVPGIDEILKKPEEAVRLDPIDENLSVMYGKPIKAFPEQEHDAHIAVHMQFLQDPSLAGNPGARTLQPVLVAHIAEHIALLYRNRMQESIGVALPNLPDLTDKSFKFKDIDPAQDMIISQRAAQVVQQAPQMKIIQSLQQGQQQGQQQDPLQYAKQLAELEAQALQAKTQAEIQTNQAKAQSDMQIDQAKAAQNIQIQQAKLEADLQGKIAKLEADLNIEREKNMIKIQQEIENGRNS